MSMNGGALAANLTYLNQLFYLVTKLLGARLI